MTLTLSPDDLHQHRKQLCEWVKANRLDPNDIPLTHPLRVEERPASPVIRYHAYVRTDDGQRQRDPNDPDAWLTTKRTAPCTIPPPHPGTPSPHARPEAST